MSAHDAATYGKISARRFGLQKRVQDSFWWEPEGVFFTYRYGVLWVIYKYDPVHLDDEFMTCAANLEHAAALISKLKKEEA